MHGYVCACVYACVCMCVCRWEEKVLSSDWKLFLRKPQVKTAMTEHNQMIVKKGGRGGAEAGTTIRLLRRIISLKGTL